MLFNLIQIKSIFSNKNGFLFQKRILIFKNIKGVTSENFKINFS